MWMETFGGGGGMKGIEKRKEVRGTPRLDEKVESYLSPKGFAEPTGGGIPGGT